MIKKANVAQMSKNNVVVDLEYDEDSRFYNGGNSVSITTSLTDNSVESIVVREYDKDGNLVTSQNFYT